jgi:dihydroxy-acid dehydratase
MTESSSGPRRLRSERWFAPETMRASAHRQRTLQMGFRREDFMGKPVIAIVNTWSDLSPCHAHLRERAEAVKRGVLLAGGFPVELPAMSLGEVMVKPTTMLYRNFLAMETEELLRSHPVDGAVLMGGCDKTTPGLLMGAISMNLPAIFLPAGPMLPGSWRGVRLGVGTHTRKYWDELRAGTIDLAQWHEIEAGIARSPGTCMTMGTASTMTAIAEVLGFVLPGGSSVPAMDADHVRLASDTGARAVQMVHDGVLPSRIMSRAAVENALVVLSAMAGSTNAAVHLIALARRAGVPLALGDFDTVARRVLPLANIMPSGEYLMQDFFEAGGLRALMSRLRAELHLDCPTVNGRTLGDNIAGATVWNDRVIRPLRDPVSLAPSLAVLFGNLAPGGCVIKPSAATPSLLEHRGRAVVFGDINDLEARIDRDDLDVDADSVLVLQHAGPRGGPGMPEWGNLPIPKKLLAQGVRDMVRISDARMSGTHYGTCVVHVAPESAVGGPLACVKSGDEIVLDVPARRLELCVSDDELQRRRTNWIPREAPPARGYLALYETHVNQAPEGCDFDFLNSRAPVAEPEIH